LIQFNILTLHRKKDQKWQVELNSTTLMPILSEDLMRALNNARFGHIQCFGNLKGDAFDPLTSADLIVLAKRI